jgi:hypothetical protein
VLGLTEPIILPADNESEFKRQVTFEGVVQVISRCAELGIAGEKSVSFAVDENLLDGRASRRYVFRVRLGWSSPLRNGGNGVRIGLDPCRRGRTDVR